MMEHENEISGPTMLHVVMFPWFGFGHIIPFCHVANKLAGAGFKITFISAPKNAARTRAALKPPAGNPIDLITISIPPVDGLPPDVESTADTNSVAVSELLKAAIDKMAPDFEAIIARLRPHAIVHDYCHDWMANVAGPLGVKVLYFSLTTAMCNAYNISPARMPPGAPVPSLDDMRRPPPGLISPGLQTFQAKDNLFIFLEFGGPSLYHRAVKCALNASGVLIRSCLEMEAPYIRYLEAEYCKPMILTGPVIPGPPAGELDPTLSSWLETHPEKSVIYCSLGSECSMTKEQLEELSLGLEMTNMPFILVLKPPQGEDVGVGLPEGLEERVKGRGMVKIGWVQQQLILAHPNVGCFVTHVGSIAEALIHDCQLVMLPQRGDQFLNSMVVSRDMGAGVEVKRRDEDGYFGREDIYDAVEAVMGASAAESELGKKVRSSRKKWMEFFRDKDIDQRLTTNLVSNIKRIVLGETSAFL